MWLPRVRPNCTASHPAASASQICWHSARLPACACCVRTEQVLQDKVEREDCTSGGQPIKYEDYPDTANYGVQVIE